MTLRRPTAAAIVGFRGWRSLRHRNYRLYFVGQLISLIGTWMQRVAEGWLVLQLTSDPFWLGVVAVAQFGPILIFGLFGGVIADGLPKRKTLIVTQSLAMLLAFILFGLTVTHTVQVWHIVLLAMALGVVMIVDIPARQAFAVEMVGREDVGNAIALNSAVFNGARVIGPAVAGLLIGATDLSIAFLLDGLSFLAVIAAYVVMEDRLLETPDRSTRPTTVRAVASNLAEGLRYVRATPVVMLPIFVVGTVATFGMNFTVVVPAVASEVLHAGASGYGFLMAASGVGSLIVALLIAFARRPRPILIGLGGVALGAASLVLAVSTSFGLSLAAMFVIGMGGIAMSATANTAIQLVVPDQLRGRVISVYMTVFAGSTPIGGLLAGSLASSLGVPLAVLVGGAGSVVAGAAGVVWYRRLRPTLDDDLGLIPAPVAGADHGPPEAPVPDAVSADAADRAGTATPEPARPSTARG